MYLHANSHNPLKPLHMKNRYCWLVLIILSAGCGDNLPTPSTPVTSFGPPTELKALSVNSSTVRIQWSAAVAANDSTFAGYVILWGSKQDSVPKSVLGFTIDSLSSGVHTFSIKARKSSGERSAAAAIVWAPAERFDSTYVLFENNSAISTRAEAFNVGTRTTNPSTMILDPLDPVVQQTMDFAFYGGSGQIEQPLAMWGASHYVGALNETRFSTVTQSAVSLDLPLAAFPAEDTFTKDSITVVDNTVYYARVIGDPGEVNYVRLHLRVRPGLIFPDRVIEVHLSLQRVPSLLYAKNKDESGRLFALLYPAFF